MFKCTLEEVLEAVAAESGCVSRIAARLKVDPTTMYRYMQNWVSVKEAVNAWRLDTAYLAEGSLRDAVIAGDPWAVQFVLKTQGKDLGYGDQSKVELETAMTVGPAVCPDCAIHESIEASLARGYGDDLEVELSAPENNGNESDVNGV